MKYAAIAWDMDGTLVDTEVLYKAATDKINAQYGLTVPSDDHTGLSLPDSWKFFDTEETKNLSFDRWRDDIQFYVESRLHEIKIFESAWHVLKVMSEKELPQTCVSNNSKLFIEKVLKKNDVHHLFEHCLGYEDVSHPKPDPAPYLYSAKLLQVAPEHCLVVEDSLVGVTSAKKAGMSCASCPA